MHRKPIKKVPALIPLPVTIQQTGEHFGIDITVIYYSQEPLKEAAGLLNLFLTNMQQQSRIFAATCHSPPPPGGAERGFSSN